MEVRNNGSYGVVIAYDSENPTRAIIVSEPEAITLRDLLLREFPVGARPIDFAGKNPAECGCMFVYGEGLRPCPTHDPIIQRKERRERIATAMLAGMLAYTPRDPNLGADDAILQADALIAALDK